MKRPFAHKLLLGLLSANAVLLVLVLIVLLARHEMLPAAWAEGPTSGASRGLVVVSGQMSSNTWGCYVVDTDTRSLCVYQYIPGEHMLRLQAARSFGQDLLLSNFNTSPSPAEVADLVDKERKAPEPDRSAPPAGKPR